MTRAPRLALLAILAAALLALATPKVARALERNFAGSAQVDYHLVPTVPGANARSVAFDGFTVEAAMKLTVDFSEKLSAQVKVCYGCHGIEDDMAYLDYRVAPELTFRFGRFSPSFGNFNLRHDPANHRLADKPLPYDMGRMLRLRAWNMGVLPSPFPDNGLEINGKLSFGDDVSVDYAAYAVAGFKGDTSGVDLDFIRSRDPAQYYVDNNGRPTVGGRLAFNARLGELTDATLGASIMRGTFDPSNQLTYTIAGADLVFRFDRTNLRFEYLVRRQEFDVSDPTRFKYEVPAGGDFFMKHGAYAELEQPLSDAIDVVGRVDGMYRVGNVLAQAPANPVPPDGLLDKHSSVVRYTVGASVSVERGLRLKASTELWQFSDEDARGSTRALGLHVGAVGTF